MVFMLSQVAMVGQFAHMDRTGSNITLFQPMDITVFVFIAFE